MITLTPDPMPMPTKSRIRRSYLFALVLAGMIAPVFIWRGAIAYRYAHIPYRSALVPRPYPQTGQSADGVAFSPNSHILAVADMQGGLSYWTVPQLHCERRFDAPIGASAATAMIWTSDGQMLSLGDTEIVQWNYGGGFSLSFAGKRPQDLTTADTLSLTHSFVVGDGYRYHSLSLSGVFAAGATPEGRFIVWNTKTGRQMFSVPNSVCGRFGYLTDFCDIAFSPDERLVATTSMPGDNSVAMAPVDVSIRDMKTGLVLRKWQWKQGYMMKIGDSSGGNLGDTGLTFSSDGALLAIADDNKVSIWDANTGNMRCMLPEVGQNWGGPKRLVFFNRNRLLAGIGWGTAIPIWDVRTGALLQMFYGDKYIQALAVSPDNHWLATGLEDENIDGRIELWDVSRLLP